MPPRHAYWTIIVEGKPTAFRAHDQEELLPTLRQLQARHPDAIMKWFARGRLWESREEERAAATRPHHRERRGPAWRPGGQHEDPRERFNIPRDEKRRRFAAKLRRDRPGEPPDGHPTGQPPRDHRPARQGPAGGAGWGKGRPASFRRSAGSGHAPSRGPRPQGHGGWRKPSGGGRGRGGNRGGGRGGGGTGR